MSELQLLDILKARENIRPFTFITPLEQSLVLAPNTFFKLENVNITHSFKIRGALNALLSQVQQATEFGVITSSAGNHGMGLVYAATLLNVDVTVVMPTHAPQRKINGAKKLGAEVILHGAIYDDAELYAREMSTKSGKLFVSAYNDPYVIAGQATIGLEIFVQKPEVERVIVPVGGGGLVTGIGMVAKAMNPAIEVIGVQSTATPAMYNFLHGTDFSQDPDTLADGLSGDIENGSMTLDMCPLLIDQMVLVEEEAIANAIRWMYREHGWVVEGSAATGIAAIQAELIPKDNRPTIIIISGGNIDADKFLNLMQG